MTGALTQISSHSLKTRASDSRKARRSGTKSTDTDAILDVPDVRRRGDPVPSWEEIDAMNIQRHGDSPDGEDSQATTSYIYTRAQRRIPRKSRSY